MFNRFALLILLFSVVQAKESGNYIVYDGKVKIVKADQISKSLNESTFIQPDYLYPVHTNDPLYNQQIYLKTIGYEEVFSLISSGSPVIIAVIDSGVDINHPDLKDNIWTNVNEIPNNGIDDDDNGYTDDVYGWDFVELNGQLSDNYLPYEDYTEPDNDPSDKSGHGTAVAGIIGAIINNGIGVAGICPNVRIMPLRAGFSLMDASKINSYVLTSAAVQAIQYAVQNGAQIINMSFGQSHPDTLMSIFISQYSYSCLFVASAGNSSIEESLFPASFNNVISVAALTEGATAPASYTTYNDNIKFCAPGDAIVCFSRPGREQYVRGRGTSFSAPQVAAALGILISQGYSRNSALNRLETRCGLFAPKLGRRLDLRKIFDIVPETTPEVVQHDLGVKGLVVLRSNGTLQPIGDIDVDYLLSKGTMNSFQGVAQDICLTPDGKAGYVVDKKGNLYRLGDAPNLGNFPTFQNEDVRAISLIYSE